MYNIGHSAGRENFHLILLATADVIWVIRSLHHLWWRNSRFQSLAAMTFLKGMQVCNNLNSSSCWFYPLFWPTYIVHPYTTEQHPKIYRHIFPNHLTTALKINSAKDSDPQLYNPNGWLQRRSRNMWLGQELRIGLTLSTQHSYRLAWTHHETVFCNYSGSKEQCPYWVQGFLQTVKLRIWTSRLPLCLFSVSLPGRAWWRGQGWSGGFLKHSPTRSWTLFSFIHWELTPTVTRMPVQFSTL